MEKEKNLKNKFRDAFKNSKPPKEDWNTPDDAIWESIAQKIDPKAHLPKNTSFPWKNLSLGLLLLTTLIGAFGWNQALKKSRQLETELQNCGEEVSAIQNDLNKKQAISQLTISPVNESNEVQMESDDRNVLKTTDSKKLDAKESLELQQLSTNSKMPHQTSQTPLASNDDRTSLAISVDKLDLNQAQEKQNNNKINTSDTDKADLKAFSSDQKVIHIAPISNENRGFLHQNYPRLLEFGRREQLIGPISRLKPTTHIQIYSGLTFGQLINQGMLNENLSELLDKEYLQNGQVIGLGINKSISSRWSFSTGFQVSRLQFISEYDVNLPYNSNLEQLTAEGDGHIDFEHSLPTSFGKIDTRLSLLRPRNSVINNANVDVHLGTRHRFTMLSIPLGLQYQVKEIPGFEIGAHLLPTLISGSSSQMTDAYSGHSGIDVVNTSSDSDYQSLNRWIMAGGIHAGWSVQVMNDLEVGIIGQYNYHFTTHYRNNEFSSRLGTWNLALSLGRRF